MKKCDIIMPVWNEHGSTRKCLEALRGATRYPYKLIIVDNGSDAATGEYLDTINKSFADAALIRNNKNLGFVKAANQGIVASSAPYVCLLNNDTYVTESWLTNLIDTVETGPQNTGIANPASNAFGVKGPDGKKGAYQELDSCKGFCMLIKREVIEKIGLFDEAYGIGYFEEKDFSRRAIKSGFACLRAKSSFVYHRDRLSFDKIKDRDEIFRRNETIYNKKWGRPFNIAFAERDGSRIMREKNEIYELLKKGHRAHLFFDKKKKVTGLKDHINIKYFPAPNFLFGYVILFKLWERFRTKKIEIIVVEDDKMAMFFKRFQFVHKAKVVTDPMLEFILSDSEGHGEWR